MASLVFESLPLYSKHFNVFPGSTLFPQVMIFVPRLIQRERSQKAGDYSVRYCLPWDFHKLLLLAFL